MNTTNPFDITKAVHYSNEQLLKYWVNFPGEGGFADILKPSSAMPMLILGGKGSGKTHVMKYFSFELQKLRTLSEDGDLRETIKNDKYLGIYMRAGNLNSKKFKGSEHSEKGWQTIFEYYFDLFLSQLTIGVINNLKELSEGILIDEEAICLDIIDLLDIWPKSTEKPTNFLDLIHCFQQLQKQLDYEVNNSAITGEKLENIDILCTGGKLILGIPKVLRDREVFLQGIQFLYLIDEYENFTKEQQQFVNTLIREVEAPISFKIGSRLYGIKTYDTYSADEEIREGSEYDKLNLDKIFREREKEYSDFVKDVCTTRLIESGILRNSDHDKLFNKYFEEFSEDEFNVKIKSSKAQKHREILSKKLENFKIPKKEITVIINNLSHDSYPILEKVAYLLLFREWKSGKRSFLEASKAIKRERENYLADGNNGKNDFKNILSYYKNDLIDQLCRTYNFPFSYIGVNSLIKMSAGIPRLVLIMLKHIVRWSNFNEEQPFVSDSLISSKSQSSGINDAIKWFLADARMPGSSGIMVQQSIQRLGQYLQALRYSDLPPECSISMFTIDKSGLSKQTVELLEYLEQYSYIIKTDERRDKNTDRLDETFQIIGIISPHWGLSINRRGAVPINKEVASVIFNEKGENDNYKDFLKQVRVKYNVPFKETSNIKTLFE